MSWGRIIHRALQVLVKDPTCDLDVMIENFLKEEGRPMDNKTGRCRMSLECASRAGLWLRLVVFSPVVGIDRPGLAEIN